MITYSVFAFSNETSFPGSAAAVPTIGAALIIYSGQGGKSFVSTILSLRPAVFIGLISYSLYLWHWPVIVYTEMYLIKTPTPFEMTAILTFIFMVSLLSWKLIESPFRTKRLLEHKQSLFSASVIASQAIIVFGLTLAISGSHLHRYGDEIAMYTKANDSEWKHWRSCRAASRVNDIKGLCDLGAKKKNISFIVWGDSHAMALASGINLSAHKHGLSGKIATYDACPPLLSIERPNRTTCNKFNYAVLRYIAHTPEIETVILAARWPLSTKGVRYKNESGGPVKLVDLKSKNTGSTNVQLFQVGLLRTIKVLTKLGKHIVIVNPVPEVGYDVPTSYRIAKITGRDINTLIAPSLDDYKRRTQEVMSIFHNIKNHMSLDIVRPELYLFDKGHFRVTTHDIPLYRDDDHLSTFGSKFISKAFDKVFQTIAIRHTKNNNPANTQNLHAGNTQR